MLYPLVELIDVVHDSIYGSVVVHRFSGEGRDIQTSKKTLNHEEIVVLDELIQKYKLPDKKNKVLDIGANHGLYGRFWAKNNPDVFVDMYEPVESTFNIAKLNTAHLPNVNVYPFPIGIDQKNIMFPIFEEKTFGYYGCVSFHPEQTAARNDTIAPIVGQYELITKSLDALYAEDNEFNFVLVKLDTEGTESIILENSINFIKNKKPIIFMEHFNEQEWVTKHDRRGTPPTQWFIDFFESINYKIVAGMGINFFVIPKEMESPFS